jgi:class 3 adenylate cyclase
MSVARPIPDGPWHNECVTVEESAELRAITLRWVKAFNDGDGTALANLYSRAEAVRYIGTDPEEWWRGRDVATVVARHLEELIEFGIDIDVAQIEAFEYGSAGWSSIQTFVTFGEGAPLPIRITLVFALEHGMWKIMQSHNSVAVKNPEVLGVHLTTGLSELLDALGLEPEADLRAALCEGTVTLMFTDIEDSTLWASNLGDEVWADVVTWHDQIIRRIVEAHSGIVVKTLGDGAMAAFESTRLGARAALEIQRVIAARPNQPKIRVRIGLHVGDVVQTGDDYLGQAVNKAARIASAANGGQIMVSTAVNALLADIPEFSFGTPFDIQLKGLPGVHQVASLEMSPVVAVGDEM